MSGSFIAFCLFNFFLLGHSDYPGCSVVKNPPSNERDMGSNPCFGKIPWRKKWQPLQHSWLQNPMDRGARWATVHGVTKNRTRLVTKQSTIYLCTESEVTYSKSLDICGWMTEPRSTIWSNFWGPSGGGEYRYMSV